MRRLLLSAAFLAAFTPSAFAEDFTKAQIEQIVHDYIASNPQVLIDSVEKYGQQQQAAQEQEANANLSKNADWLFKNDHHAQAGNPKGDVTIVEFFDYNCGYCKKALPDIMTLLDQDKNLRLVFVEIPILGDSSVTAARWALAANRQKAYLEYHIALMKHNGRLDDATLEDYARKVGLDVEKLKKDKDDPEIAKTLDDNINMARTLGIQGTPAFVINDQMVRGYVGLDGLKTSVDAAHAKAAKK